MMINELTIEGYTSQISLTFEMDCQGIITIIAITADSVEELVWVERGSYSMLPQIGIPLTSNMLPEGIRHDESFIRLLHSQNIFTTEEIGEILQLECALYC